jgi:hypothetical protein
MVATLASLLFLGTFAFSLAVIVGMTSSQWTQIRASLRNIAPLGLEIVDASRRERASEADTLVSLSALTVPVRW